MGYQEDEDARRAGQYGGYFDRNSASPGARYAYDEQIRHKENVERMKQSFEAMNQPASGVGDNNTYGDGRGSSSIGPILLLVFIVGPALFILLKPWWNSLSDKEKISFAFLFVFCGIAGLLFYKIALPKIISFISRALDKLLISPKTGKLRLGVRIVYWSLSILISLFVLFLLALIIF